MDLTQIIEKHGDEIKVQQLAPSITNVRKTRGLSQVTFITNQIEPGEVLTCNYKMVGVVLWIPRHILEQKEG